MAVTPSDIAAALGRPASPTAVETPQWQQWISDARMLLQYGDGTRAGLGDLTLLSQSVLDYVVREAVLAHIRHPEDATQVDVTVDATSVSKRYQSGSGRVKILPEWWGMLDPQLEDFGAFSISPTGKPYVAVAWNATSGAQVVSDILPGDPYFPWDVAP